MATSTPKKKPQMADALGHCTGSTTLDTDIPSPFAFGKTKPLTAFKKISVSARRALNLVARSAELRGLGRVCSEGDEAPRGFQTLAQSSPRSPCPAYLKQLSQCSFNSNRTSSLPSPSESTDLCVDSPRPPETVPDQAYPLPQQPLTPAPPTRPRSLLSALLNRPSSSALTDKERPGGGLSQALKPDIQVGCQAAGTCPAHPQLRQSSPEVPGHVPPPPQTGPLGRLHESLPVQQDRPNHVLHPLLSPLRQCRSTAPTDEHMEMCLSAPCADMAILSQIALEVDTCKIVSTVPAAATTAEPSDGLATGKAFSTSIPATSLLSSSCAQPRLSGVLLATSTSTPVTMMRSSWALEDYSLHRRLYKGKMSSVYKGRCLRSGLPVALKVYFKARVPANVIHMVMREVSIHIRLSDHKNVLKLYGVFQTDELVVLVMELATRGSLSGVCRGISGGRLSEIQVRQLVLEPLLDSLAYLHAKGVCHRDIKPENMLFTADWGFRLADFGVSINLVEERAVTRAGTADYMAPEVERCPLKASPNDNKDDHSLAYTTAADVWSVGVLAYELLVGFPPVLVDGPRLGAMDQGSRVLSFPASVSPGARDFITASLAQQPQDRPTVRQLRCHPWVAAGTAGIGKRLSISTAL